MPQAFSALFAIDFEASAAENAENMSDALSDVRDGEVTHAVRDSSAADGTPIHAGDIMGIQNDDILVVGSSVDQVALDLIARMMDEEEGDTLTILAGADMADADFAALVGRIEEAYPDLDIESHRGEQPLYPVIFSIE